MRNTIPPDEVFSIMEQSFPWRLDPEAIPLERARGRILSQPAKSREAMICFALGRLSYIGAFLQVSTHAVWAVPAFLAVYGVFLSVVLRL